MEAVTKKKRKNYDKEYKMAAVKMVLEDGRQVAEVSDSLGICENMLHRWKREYLTDSEHGFPGKGHLKPMEEEVRQLKRELERVTRERDILKKAIAIFSKTPQ